MIADGLEVAFVLIGQLASGGREAHRAVAVLIDQRKLFQGIHHGVDAGFGNA